jgi:hypothetical protein
VRAALAWAQPDDLLILPIHESRQDVLQFLAAQSNGTSPSGGGS